MPPHYKVYPEIRGKIRMFIRESLLIEVGGRKKRCLMFKLMDRTL